MPDEEKNLVQLKSLTGLNITPKIALEDIQDTAEIKEKPASSDYISIIDSEDEGKMKKLPLSALKVSGGAGVDEIIVGPEFPEDYVLQIDPTGDGLDFDATPTEGSNNLVTSGVIYDIIEELKNKITYGTEDLEDGVSSLPTGHLYVVYEENYD